MRTSHNITMLFVDKIEKLQLHLSVEILEDATKKAREDKDI